MKTQFENIVDDSFDETHLYQLFSQAKNYVERTEKPEICKKLDSSQSASVGDTYLSLKSLPSDFRTPIKISLDNIPYDFVKFEDQVLYRYQGNKVFLDMRQNKFATTGSVSRAGTWNLFYIYKTTDFTIANKATEVCVWPTEFQPLIPYQAAKIYQANIDGDAISFRMSSEQELEYQRLLSAFRAWNQDLILATMNGRTGFDPAETDQGYDLGTM